MNPIQITAEVICEQVNSALVSESYVHHMLKGTTASDGQHVSVDHKFVIEIPSHTDKHALEDVYQDALEHVFPPLEHALLEVLQKVPSRTCENFQLSTLRDAEKLMRPDKGYLLMAFDVWNDIRTDVAFADLFDPTCKHAAILCGELGTLDGGRYALISDAYRHDTIRTIPLGSWFICADDLGAANGQVGVERVEGHRAFMRLQYTMNINPKRVVWGARGRFPQ